MCAIMEEKYELILMTFPRCGTRFHSKNEGEDYTSLVHLYLLVDEWVAQQTSLM
jgi:hypothetical protein